MSWRKREATTRQKGILFEWELLPSRLISWGEAANLIRRVLKGWRRWKGK